MDYRLVFASKKSSKANCIPTNATYTKTFWRDPDSFHIRYNGQSPIVQPKVWKHFLPLELLW